MSGFGAGASRWSGPPVLVAHGPADVAACIREVLARPIEITNIIDVLP
jgi:hypothetical protein